MSVRFLRQITIKEINILLTVTLRAGRNRQLTIWYDGSGGSASRVFDTTLTGISNGVGITTATVTGFEASVSNIICMRHIAIGNPVACQLFANFIYQL
jgi:hypothetical protein